MDQSTSFVTNQQNRCKVEEKFDTRIGYLTNSKKLGDNQREDKEDDTNAGETC